MFTCGKESKTKSWYLAVNISKTKKHDTLVESCNAILNLDGYNQNFGLKKGYT